MRTSAKASLSVVAVVIAAAAVETAHGGVRETPPGSTVLINVFANSAEGAMGAVRATGDGNQNIGCVIDKTFANPPQLTVGCSAIDSTGLLSAVCFFPSNLLGTAVLTAVSITSDSHIRFTWDASGNCTSLRVNNDSTFQPKTL